MTGKKKSTPKNRIMEKRKIRFMCAPQNNKIPHSMRWGTCERFYTWFQNSKIIKILLTWKNASYLKEGAPILPQHTQNQIGILRTANPLQKRET